MIDWRSYDHIAARYDDVWGSRFEAVARHIWLLAPPAAEAVVLDVGTGTGIVPRALGARAGRLVGVIGCDRSAGMLCVARKAMPTLAVVAAEATALPFRQSVFDVVTASFVLSHLPDYRAGLMEARRVLKSSGAFVATSWSAGTDPSSEAWGRLLAGAVSKERLKAAVAQVAPSEERFEKGDNLLAALAEAGFVRGEVHTITMEVDLSTESYIADRELSSGGRFGQAALGPERWADFTAHAREELHRLFGPQVHYVRGVLIGVGWVPHTVGS